MYLAIDNSAMQQKEKWIGKLTGLIKKKILKIGKMNTEEWNDGGLGGSVG